MELGGLVVVGLREAPSVASAVVYRVLSRLFQTRDEEPAGDAAPSPMSIDEAHSTSRRRASGTTSTRRWWRP
jgi:IMP cyclohydrolase